jgi:hypothetical protein
MDCLPWSTFTRIVARYDGDCDYDVRTFPCVEQYRAMAFAQLTYREGLRDIETCLPAQPAKLYHMGWGLNIDGNDDVWAGNIGPLNNGVVLMAGVDTKGHLAGAKPGDVLHVFRGGSIQLLTDVSIDLAGDVWAANNWNLPKCSDGERSRPTLLHLERRLWTERQLRRGRTGEAAAHGQSATVLTKTPNNIIRLRQKEQKYAQCHLQFH